MIFVKTPYHSDRRKKRKAKSLGAANTELLDRLPFNDKNKALNLGRSKRTVQRWSAGDPIDETTLLLLWYVEQSKIDLVEARRALGLETYGVDL